MVSRFGTRPHRCSAAFALAGLVLATWVSVPVEAADLYGVSWDSSALYEIDTATGAATLVGPTGQIDLGGIAFDGTGALYAFKGSSVDIEFYSIDPGTGTATLVGLTGIQGGEGALVWDPVAGVFYTRANLGGSGGGLTMELASIDPGTGAGTLIGNMGLNVEADVSGMALLPDGTLIGFDSQSALPSRLVEIDKGTGVATVIGPTGENVLSSLGGLAVDPDTGVVYMSNGFSLFTVDPGTGAATEIGSHGVTITGLSFRPTPSCLIGLDEDSTLFDVDPSDGSTSNPRPMLVDQLGALALSPGGTLYATRSSPNGELYTADIASGAATLVGPTGISLREGGLDFDPVSGQLYGVNGGSGGLLFTLDLGTGSASAVGVVVDEFAQPIDASALAFDGAGTLYVLKTQTAPAIYRVNPTDASVFERVPIPGFPAGIGVGGMEFDDATGTLYVSMDSKLVVLDPATGATTLLGPTPATSGLEVVGPCAAPPSTVPAVGPWGLLVLVPALVGGALSTRVASRRR